MSGRKMVDSGVEWIGEVPEGWRTVRLGDIAKIETGSMNTDDRDDNGRYPLYVRSQTVEKCNKYTHDNEAILVPGEGLIGQIFHLAKGKHAVHQRVYSVQPKIGAEIRFSRYCMMAGFGDWAKQNSNTVTVESLRRPTFTNFAISMPDLSTQIVIANFLDHHVDLIDRERALIAKKIELLKDKRQAAIFECVTGKRQIVESQHLAGVDDWSNIISVGHLAAVPTPEDRLVDSGVDWIGEVPEGWNISHLKDVASFTVGKTPDTSNPDFFDGGLPWITITDLDECGSWPTDTQRTLSEAGVKASSIKTAKQGSLLVSFKLSIGKTAIAKNEVFTNEAVAAVNCNPKSSNKYLRWSLPAAMNAEATENIYGAKIYNQDQLGRASLTVPPLFEQQAIADFLDRYTALIDREIALLKSKSDILLSKRQSLIFEAVTGKIDLSEHV